jgi:hypothetical protein
MEGRPPGQLPEIVLEIDSAVRFSWMLLAREPNRGESSHTLQHAIHSGKIPAALSKRTESLAAVSSALSLLSNCVMAWNAAHMQTALDGIKQAGGDSVTQDLRSIAPTNIEGWQPARDV